MGYSTFLVFGQSDKQASRCPIECRSKYTDEPWVGRVFLRFEVEAEDGSVDQREISFGGLD